MVQVEKIEGRMREKRITIEEMARKMGISAMTLHNKLRRKSDFKNSEMTKVKEILELSTEEALQIFLQWQ